MITMSPQLVALNLEFGISSEFLVTRHLFECQEASCLEVAEVGYDGRDYLLTPAAASAWRNPSTLTRAITPRHPVKSDGEVCFFKT